MLKLAQTNQPTNRPTNQQTNREGKNNMSPTTICGGHKNAPPPGDHIHNDRTINVASRVLTSKNAPPPGNHVFQAPGTIFKLVQDIIGTNFLTKFHEDRTINVASRILTRQMLTPQDGDGLKAISLQNYYLHLHRQCGYETFNIS
ncbi:hypothetical protein DPMN_192603 [Dreissena polymorpha]|uniref:Uncharacterized protein n=1 Tax=Dreissena polymorpha TaxID=45954 RepID=A0A9D3Y6L8_DREPO|nr:hypothetical protein DPMN_192603 [Dreissena polymorpha]